MTTSGRLTREQILALPPVITLAQLARILDVSEPTIRRAHRDGQLEAMGIKVNKLGNQYRCTLASVLAYLGLAGGASNDSSPSAAAGQRDRTGHDVRFLAPVRAVD